MNRALLIADWNILTPSERASIFQSWMGTSSSASGQAQITQLVLHSSSSSDEPFYTGFAESDDKPIMQVSVLEDLFALMTSDQAIEAGDNILMVSRDYYQLFNLNKQYNKDYQKQIDKWLEKMKKELFKEMAKAYAEMAKYFAKKYWDKTS